MAGVRAANWARLTSCTPDAYDLKNLSLVLSSAASAPAKTYGDRRAANTNGNVCALYDDAKTFEDSSDRVGDCRLNAIAAHWASGIALNKQKRGRSMPVKWANQFARTWPSADVATARMTMGVIEMNLENMFTRESL